MTDPSLKDYSFDKLSVFLHLGSWWSLYIYFFCMMIGSKGNMNHLSMIHGNWKSISVDLFILVLDFLDSGDHQQFLIFASL